MRDVILSLFGGAMAMAFVAACRWGLASKSDVSDLEARLDDLEDEMESVRQQQIEPATESDDDWP